LYGEESFLAVFPARARGIPCLFDQLHAALVFPARARGIAATERGILYRRALIAGFYLRQPPRPAYGARRGDIKPGSANKK
jgi:hypothetical protein